MATKIQLRRDTAANWASANPILSEGEIGFEKDTKKKKIGDGVTAWNSLDYDKELPSQAGKTGKYLTTNGISASWETVEALPTQSPAVSSQFLVTDGTSASWKPLKKIHYVDPMTTGMGITYSSDGEYADYATLNAAIEPLEGQWARLIDQTVWRGSKNTDNNVFWFPFGTHDVSLPPYIAGSNGEDAIAPLYNGTNAEEPIFIYFSRGLDDSYYPFDITRNYTITMMPDRQSDIPFIGMVSNSTGNMGNLVIDYHLYDLIFNNTFNPGMAYNPGVMYITGFISPSSPRKEIEMYLHNNGAWFIKQQEDFASSDNGRGLQWFSRNNAIEGMNTKSGYIYNSGLMSNITDNRYSVLTQVQAKTAFGTDGTNNEFITINGTTVYAEPPFGIYHYDGVALNSILYLPGSQPNTDVPIGTKIQLVLENAGGSNYIVVISDVGNIQYVSAGVGYNAPSLAIYAKGSLVEFMRVSTGWIYIGDTTIID